MAYSACWAQYEYLYIKTKHIFVGLFVELEYGIWNMEKQSKKERKRASQEAPMSDISH